MKKITTNQKIKIDLFNPAGVKKPIEIPENVIHITFHYDTAERYSEVLIQNIYSLLSDCIGAEKLRELRHSGVGFNMVIRFNSKSFDRYLEVTTGEIKMANPATGGKHDRL